ncbi:Shugoshin [Caenorhabditis elegans]|uniref:Isoform a of Shugoshin n=1 Tax=Caenorhabditis elegans TaxID=6239 RepID=Q18412-2|nr:Shugoshin [Caenorhabditis elegans]CCD66579.1 Shugoshin [Caenorhabditis elegans]|eukprot:NP_501290.2 Shugoshin [Caenorhabditis elegans]
MDAKTAQSIFGGIVAAKKRPSKEVPEPTINFKSANDSLVKKNLLLKQQVVQCTKTIEKLRNENVALRQKNQELIDGTLEQRIELIVEQRLKFRLAHAAVLHKKLVQNIQQTGLELDGLFKDLEPEPSGLNTRRPPKLELNLERVDEIPFCQSSMQGEIDENEIRFDNNSSQSTSSIQNAVNGTPRKKQSVGKGRRSELFQSFNADSSIVEEASTIPTNRRAPMLIAPSSTPAGPSKPTARKPPTPRFKKPSTPALAPQSDDTELSSTVRRQRSAKMNIKSLKEPSGKDKLRRPGKHDEPMPYINTFF